MNNIQYLLDKWLPILNNISTHANIIESVESPLIVNDYAYDKNERGVV